MSPMNLFEAIFKHDPASPAIIFDGQRLTYGDLRAQTVAMAKAIVQLGVQRGDRVALLLHDSPEFVQAFIAASSLGAIVVPINMAIRLEEQKAILYDSGARVA